MAALQNTKKNEQIVFYIVDMNIKDDDDDLHKRGLGNTYY